MVRQVGKTVLNYDVPTGRYSDPVISMDIPDELSRSHHETKTTGKDLSDIGTQQLHKKHDVAVEKLDSGLARAKVRDQLAIDRLLFDDVINIGQHAEAERLLNLAQKAGVS